MRLSLDYLYSPETYDKVRHEEILTLLSGLQHDSRVVEVSTRDHREAFPTDEDRSAFLEKLRDFGCRHHVGLGRVFGSRRHRFWWLPPQFLLVYDSSRLCEVFPCDIEDTRVEPEEFLERLWRGEPWVTLAEARHRGPQKHQVMVERIRKDPDVVETGATIVRTDVHVSRGFAEVGYVDVVLRDRAGRYLLLEVKVKADEIDKAIGQILRHRELFCSQNLLEPGSVRLGIACPYVPEHARRVCLAVGIEAFELSWSPEDGSASGKSSWACHVAPLTRSTNTLDMA
jgi:hypothetical protein